MATLTFKNSRGELVDIPSVAATRVKNKFGEILEQVTHNGAVAITRNDDESCAAFTCRIRVTGQRTLPNASCPQQ
jgi:hypothetical protein